MLAAKRAATLAAGLCAMLTMAETVSVGSFPSGAGALEKSVAQSAVPSELTQLTRRFARELISACGTVAVAADVLDAGQAVGGVDEAVDGVEGVGDAANRGEEWRVAEVGGVGHVAGERVGGDDGSDLVDKDEGNRGGEVGMACRALTEGGHESQGGIVFAGRKAGVAAESQEIDLLAFGAGVVAGDAEVAGLSVRT